MNRFFALGLVPLVAMVSIEAQAAETGSIRGTITGADGAPIAGATVTLTGKHISGELTIESDADGDFKFLTLPVGDHELLVIVPNMAPVRVRVTVRLDETVTVPVQVTQSEAGEEIIVEAEQPVIDTSRSAVSTELSSVQLQNLPVGRSYQDVVNMLPGVSGRVDTQNGGPGNGNPSVRGEGQYGNNYMVDGISTRDPATKTFGANVNFDAIESIQVYTDGAPAEFGQATGMLVNVVTKSGGDEHHGTAAYYFSKNAGSGTYDILNLESGEEEPKEKRKFYGHSLALTAGGPILKEKIWYQGAVTLSMDEIKFEGLDPEQPYKGRGYQFLGKLTWFATPDFILQYELNGSGSELENYETSGLYSSDAQANKTSGGIGHILTGRFRPDALTEVELKGSYLPINVNVVPASGDEEAPSFVNLDTGEYYGNYDSFDYNQRTRAGGSFKITRGLENAGGDHKIKVGGEFWNLLSTRTIEHTGAPDGGAVEDPGGYQYWASADAGRPCDDRSGFTDCFGYTEYVDVGALGTRGSIMGGFIQDDWSPVDGLTANLGVRFDSETLFANISEDDKKGEKVLSAPMPAPRAGLAWDVTGDNKTLVSFNAGRYYDLNGNTFADWASTRSANVYREYQYNPEIDDYELVWEQDPATNPLVYCTEDSLAKYKDHLINDYGYDEESAEAERSMTWTDWCGEKTLKPYHLDKFVLGFEREIVPNLAVGVRGIMSMTRNLPEDIDVNLDTWVIANPDSLPGADEKGYVGKRRDYKALEFTMEKKFDGRWSALVSYTLSEAKGHSPGQFEIASGGQTGSNGNGVGVYMDDISDPDSRAFYYDVGYGWLVDGLAGLGTAYDDAGYYGYLPYHAFHNVKINGFYSFPFGTTLGAVYEYSSGNAYQKRGLVPLYGDYFSFPEGRGTRMMPSLHYIDFRVAHKVDLGNGRSVEGIIDLFNLPDLEGVVTRYENDNESFDKAMFRQAPRSARLGLKVTY